MQTIHSHLDASFAALFGVQETPTAVDAYLVHDDEPIESVSPSVELTVAQRFESLWQKGCLAIDEAAAARNQFRSEEAALFKELGHPRYSVLGTVSPSECESDKDSLAKGMFAALIWLASKQFGSDGSEVPIDRNNIHEKLYADEHLSHKTFHADALWELLERTYGGDNGKRLALEKLATEFYRAFGLSRQDKVEVKGGYTIINLHAYCDSFDKKYGRNRLSYSSQESLVSAFRLMAQVMNWASLDDLAEAIVGFAKDLSYRDDLVSRARFNLGDKSEVIVITYLNRFEVRMNQQVAEQVQIFLGNYLKLE